jgi:hypothetical protein
MFQPYLKHPIFEKQLHKKATLLQVAVFLRTALHKLSLSNKIGTH